MSVISAVLLGVVEGLTEFLPVSSTAHLVIAANVLSVETTSFIKSYEIAIQLGAIMAVGLIYWRLIISSKKLVGLILLAFLPTALIGALAYEIVVSRFLEDVRISLFTLGLGGVALIIFESIRLGNETRVESIEDITPRKAVIIGLAQSVAVIPGVSRAAATIICGSLLGLSRRVIVEFSFLLAIPTMLGAVSFDLLRTGASFSSREWLLMAVGFVTSLIVAAAAVKTFLKYIQSHSFRPFGYYRIIAAVLFALIVLS